MRIIGLASSKGGVGKTTSSVHLASALVGCGASVLLVDLDPQGAVCHALGAPEPDTDATSTMQLADEGCIPRVIEHPTMDGLRILGSRPDVDHLQHAFATGRLREFALQLEPAPDFVIVDLAPSMEPLTLWALNELDSVLLVVQATSLAVRTIPTMLANVTHHCESTTVEGLLINHLGNMGQFGEAVAQSIRDTFGDWVFPVEIPFDEEIQRAALEGRSSWEVVGSPAADAFKLAAAEIIERTFRLVALQSRAGRTGEPVETATSATSGSQPAATAASEAWPFDGDAFDDGPAFAAPNAREGALADGILP